MLSSSSNASSPRLIWSDVSCSDDECDSQWPITPMTTIELAGRENNDSAPSRPPEKTSRGGYSGDRTVIAPRSADQTLQRPAQAEKHSEAEPRVVTVVDPRTRDQVDIPLDDEGMPTSVGSFTHFSGVHCKPCTFLDTPAGCHNGAMCGFCHFRKHTKSKVKRPSKAKRSRYNDMKKRVSQDLESQPEHTTED
eukprot:TRINITY_DN67334_c0_g1_i1.p1 TRINITY_DN67334_c0_g1~~TRINITY_DN67334_c0_g1_i1.p1  ORF type:complete len:193 (-),score=24.52 TRINITY_DN67334_c0_g1_i1:56-634(-)